MSMLHSTRFWAKSPCKKCGGPCQRGSGFSYHIKHSIPESKLFWSTDRAQLAFETVFPVPAAAARKAEQSCNLYGLWFSAICIMYISFWNGSFCELPFFCYSVVTPLPWIQICKCFGSLGRTYQCWCWRTPLVTYSPSHLLTFCNTSHGFQRVWCCNYTYAHNTEIKFRRSILKDQILQSKYEAHYPPFLDLPVGWWRLHWFPEQSQKLLSVV